MASESVEDVAAEKLEAEKKREAEAEAKRLKDYRDHLQAAGVKCQDDYDKTVLSLSGGALAVSFVFIKDFVGAGAIQLPGWLFAAWVMWALSGAAVLASFLMSHYAIRYAMDQVDKKVADTGPAGGFFSKATKWLNLAGAALFLGGVICMGTFVYSNLQSRGAGNVRQGENSSHPSSETKRASAQDGQHSTQGQPGQGLHPSGPATEEEVVVLRWRRVTGGVNAAPVSQASPPQTRALTPAAPLPQTPATDSPRGATGPAATDPASSPPH